MWNRALHAKGSNNSVIGKSQSSSARPDQVLANSP